MLVLMLRTGVCCWIGGALRKRKSYDSDTLWRADVRQRLLRSDVHKKKPLRLLRSRQPQRRQWMARQWARLRSHV